MSAPAICAPQHAQATAYRTRMLARSTQHPALAASTAACWVYVVAVTHSGMTLAPLVGQLVAQEVLAVHGNQGHSASSGLSEQLCEETAQALAPYRPDRDFEAAVARAAAQPSLSWTAMLKPSRQ